MLLYHHYSTVLRCTATQLFYEFHCTHPHYSTAPSLLHCTAPLYSTALYSLRFSTTTTLHYNPTTPLYFTNRCCALQCISPALHATALYCTALHWAVLFCIVLHCTVYLNTSPALHCILLHGAVHFTILHPIIMYFTACTLFIGKKDICSCTAIMTTVAVWT